MRASCLFLCFCVCDRFVKVHFHTSFRARVLSVLLWYTVNSSSATIPFLSYSAMRIVFTVCSHSLTFGFDQWVDMNVKRTARLFLFLSSLPIHAHCMHVQTWLSQCVRSLVVVLTLLTHPCSDRLSRGIAKVLANVWREPNCGSSRW